MMRTVQLVIADAVYAAALRDALSHSGPWHVEFVDRPNLERPGVLVLDEPAFERLALPLARGMRWMQTFRKLPNASPNRKTAVVSTGSMRLQESVDYYSRAPAWLVAKAATV